MALTRRALPALIVASLGISTGVRAEPLAPTPPLPKEDTFGVYVYGGSLYDSNPFLVSGKEQARQELGTSDTSDLITRAGAGLQIKWPISLQTLRFNGTVEYDHYQHFNSLNHMAANADVAWDWEIGRLWSGTIENSYTRDIASFEEFRSVKKDIQTQLDTSANAGFQFLPDWQWVVGARRRAVTFDVHNDLNRVESTAFTEVHYDTPVNTRMGLRAEITRGDLEKEQLAAGAFASNDYTEEQYSFVLGVESSEQLSYVTGRIGYTQRRYDELTGRDFSGPTFRLSYLWQITPITSLRISGWRELQSQNDEIVNYVVAQGYSLEPVWQATLKIRVRAQYSFQDMDFKGGKGTADPDAGRVDRENTFGLGIDYEALSNLYFSIAATHQSRDSNREDRKFDDDQVSAGVTYAF
ncbi:MAG TPA: outer membrane beta-barrel protein [Nitrococcus sp.]|nr:outer membrane beta-barrel protein [Nitrococcus sp.]